MSPARVHNASPSLTPADGRERFVTSPYYRGGGRVDESAQGFTVHAEFHLQCEVRLVSGVFDPASPDLAEVYRPFGRCVAIVDEHVHRVYGDAIAAYFAGCGIELLVMVCRALEADKTLSTVARIVDYLGPNGREVTRNEPVLVIGGGVLSDTAGLACALLHRRTPYVMVATSLVAAIDAGPSPRTCVNTDGLKNSVGAYHPPALTLVDRSLFVTQSAKTFRHGLAEVLKMAIVDDEALFTLLEERGPDLVTSRLASAPPSAAAATDEAIIYRTLRSYLGHEGPNMFETYQDRPHAFGHTWSPGFEPAARLLHGHAVSIEMAFSATMATVMGWISASDRDRILNLCQRLDLAIYHPVITKVDTLTRAQQAMRAKRGGHALWAPLPRAAIGQCDYAQDISDELLKETIETHRGLCTARQNSGGIDPLLG